MPFEILSQIIRINEHPIKHIGETAPYNPHGPTKQKFITVDHDEKTLSIKFQDGPMGEVGLNGIQIDVAIMLVIKICLLYTSDASDE